MSDRSHQRIVDDLLEQHGHTFAAQAGITLRDKPAPLFQLLVLATLSAAPISAEVAAATAHELFRAGWRTPERMRAATWQQRVDALGRGGYRRFDERTATVLEESAGLLLERHGGDLRRLRRAADGDLDRLLDALEDLPRVGPSGSRIFAREVQAVWPEVAPFFDDRGLDRAGALGLPTDVAELAATVGGDPAEVARLSAALVRSALGAGRRG
ncbi:hypothetical protein I601_1983 [Nocardioides dokdonensis FR1436]|uniref:Endonuclease III n=1 Tax=Nocardioides dokdonensis FR1436 TaxID=1300347 RepID=A0A1A9GL78_9ACTN|nr:endonuclease [Nocardioides dokdonensis]ANH38412.1 hypothetical protein I601_1983 [Nocardioides dokdonensis FR1436]